MKFVLLTDKSTTVLFTNVTSIILYFFLSNVIWATPIDEGKSAYRAKDYDRAIKIFKPLAEEGDSEAQQMLGIIYDQVSLNHEEAFKWYLKAAEQGVPTAQHDVGVRYFQGLGTTQNYAKAAHWWEQSANAGLADSQFNLGLLNYRGLGKEKDFRKAAELFLKSAEQGHGSAQYSLAVMHAFGQGMEKNEKEAFEWFEKSAAQGIAQAQYNLGVLYESGTQVEKDLTIAKQWYEKAAEQGLSEARNRLAQLELQHPESTESMNTEITENIKHPVETKKIIPETDPSEIKREDWILQQNPGYYTLQISSVLQERDIIQFIKKNKLGPEVAYVKVIINDTTRYAALYGVYKTYDLAKNGIKDLPVNIQKAKPWVRNLGIIHGLLKKSSG